MDIFKTEQYVGKLAISVGGYLCSCCNPVASINKHTKNGRKRRRRAKQLLHKQSRRALRFKMTKML